MIINFGDLPKTNLRMKAKVIIYYNNQTNLNIIFITRLASRLEMTL